MQNLDKTKTQGPSIRLSMVATSTRQTPHTDFGTVMRDGLIKAGSVTMDGLKVAAPFIPGSAIVSAAVAGANLASTSGAGYSETGAVAGAVGGSHAGLTGGGGPVRGTATPGTYGGGNLALPGRGPGLDTNLGTGSANGAVGTGNSGTSDAFSNMMAQTKSMAEFQASFNLQYLQLQEKIQQDTRQFNLVSNIMKTKHDAAKNALNNVR